MLKNILKQLLLLLVTAGVISYTLHIFGVSWVAGILIGIIAQYGIYNAFVYGFEAYITLRARKLENDKLRELTYQGLDVTCPCSRQAKEFVPVRFNTPNYYKCKTCTRTVGVFVAAETVLVTEPIADTDLSSVERLIQDKLTTIAPNGNT